MINMDFNFDYLPSDIEDEIFLSEVPLELIEKAIQTQFMDPFEYRKKDYVQSFLTKYKFSQDNNFNTDEDRYTIEKYHDDFMGFMLGIFDIYLSLGFPDFDSKPEEDQHELIHMTYRFFIKNIKKNFVNLIMNYTNNNIEDLVEMLSKKKDVTSLNFKLEIENDNDVVILSNLSELIQYILNIDFSVDEFLELATGNDSCLELEFVKEAFEDTDIVGNFISKYREMLDEYSLIELESKVRSRILKKYPLRKKTEDTEQNDENEIINDEETE